MFKNKLIRKKIDNRVHPKGNRQKMKLAKEERIGIFVLLLLKFSRVYVSRFFIGHG